MQGAVHGRPINSFRSAGDDGSMRLGSEPSHILGET